MRVSHQSLGFWNITKQYAKQQQKMQSLESPQIIGTVYKSDLFSFGIKSSLRNTRCLLNVRNLDCKPSKERPVPRVKS